MTNNAVNLFHLYSRAEFYRSPSKINFEGSLKNSIEDLLNAESSPISYELPSLLSLGLKELSGEQKEALVKKWRKDVQAINQIWIQKMVNSDGLLEKMTFFFHGHFACRTIKNPYHTLQLNNILRKHALGSFRDMLIDVSQSAGMINYLHLKQNKKSSPNEDFARELMELFTLGRDVNYTEKDISEVARAFTGWSAKKSGEFEFNQNKHDQGYKTIFGQTGNFNGYDVIDMILRNKACATHVSKKIYQFFVREKVNNSHIAEMATALYNSNYNLKELMRFLLNSPWFYESRGEIIKSPVELIVALGKQFNLKYENIQGLVRLQKSLGQELFNPPNVAGWPPGRAWIDGASLALRMRVGALILNNGVIDSNTHRQPKKQQKLYEEVEWNRFWQRSLEFQPNQHLVSSNSKYGTKNEIQDVLSLLSSPEYQLT